jgi:short-subunit dehydrogenase involved in D-alanine esterification of teichoic acids
VTRDHPDVDCLVNNAGVQRPFEVFGKDYDFDLTKADEEIDINIRGPMHLTLGLLPHLAQKPTGGVVMNVSSVLGFIPFSIINPVYNGTKAWLHFWSIALRKQLEQQGKNVKVVEIAPPSVESNLHRDRTDPDDNKKHKGASALSMEEFMEDVRKGWEAGDDLISAGMGKEIVQDWEDTMGKRFKAMVK